MTDEIIEEVVEELAAEGPHKLVNGVKVYLTEEEIAEIEQVEPLPEPVVVVTMRQARKALVLSGVNLDSIYQVIETIADPVERQIAVIDWDFADSVPSDSSLVDTVCAALDLDKAALFALAVTL